MNDYKPYKQLKQKQKAKVVERMYKELHQFFSDNQTIFYKGIMPSEVDFRFSSG